MKSKAIAGNFTNSQIVAVIDEYVNGSHAERNRRILKRRYIDGICFEPLAEEFNLSTRHVKQIVYQYEWTIFRHLE